MAEFQGKKFITVDGGDYYSAEYVEWLEQRIANLRQSNTNLRKRMAAYERSQNRRLQQEYDHVEYPDDDYER